MRRRRGAYLLQTCHVHGNGRHRPRCAPQLSPTVVAPAHHGSTAQHRAGMVGTSGDVNHVNYRRPSHKHLRGRPIHGHRAASTELAQLVPAPTPDGSIAQSRARMMIPGCDLNGVCRPRSHRRLKLSIGVAADTPRSWPGRSEHDGADMVLPHRQTTTCQRFHGERAASPPAPDRKVGATHACPIPVCLHFDSIEEPIDPEGLRFVRTSSQISKLVVLVAPPALAHVHGAVVVQDARVLCAQRDLYCIRDPSHVRRHDLKRRC